MVSTAREITERAGIDVDVLIDRMVSAAVAELTLFYRFMVLSARSVGVMDGAFRDLLRDTRAEDRNHFDALVTRIYELDGRLPMDITLFVNGISSGARIPDGHGDDPGDLAVEFILPKSRMSAAYTELCELTEGRDRRTHAIVRAILNEEAEHEAWYHELLGTGGPARHRRGFRGRSPYLTSSGAGLPGSG